MFIKVIFIICLNIIGVTTLINRCSTINSFRRFYKIRSCAISSEKMIARKHTKTLEDCFKYGREKDGLALNYSPTNSINTYYNCHVLACPEFTNFSSLSNNTDFDYYSSYANFNSLTNATCIPSVGLFKLFETKENYTTAITQCHKNGGDLANIVNEDRTNDLSDFIKVTLNLWYKAAYVGLDDINTEGEFVTTTGEPLSCFKYRAWAPGHPRSKYKREDCVILDSERMWRVVNCKQKLPFLCELYPEGPQLNNNDFDCSNAFDSQDYEDCMNEANQNDYDENCEFLR